ncbi:MAG: MBG domain-containing protein, partial [Opitutales bacterium]
ASFTTSANITPAPLTVTAAAAVKTYDGLAYVGGNGVSYSGLVPGETAAVLGGALTYGGDSQNAVNAGAYVITPGGLTSSNYAITFVDGALTVNRRTITGITGVTAQDKVYDGLTGATLDTTAPVFAGLLPGDQLTITGATGAFGSAGAANGKTVTVNGLTFGGSDLLNYDLPASFTTSANITPAPLTVTADNKTKASDGAVFGGGFTVSYGGFVAGQGPSDLMGLLVFSGPAVAATTAGSHAIIPSGLVSVNYDLIFQQGTLTITGSAAPLVDPRDFLPRITPVPTFPTTTPVTLTVSAPSPVSVPAAPAVTSAGAPSGGTATGQQAASGPGDSAVTGGRQAPLAVGGLNYVPTSPEQADRAAQNGAGSKEGDTARDKVEGGAVTRSLQAVTDVLVIEGGINLGRGAIIRE